MKDQDPGPGPPGSLGPHDRLHARSHSHAWPCIYSGPQAPAPPRAEEPPPGEAKGAAPKGSRLGGHRDPTRPGRRLAGPRRHGRTRAARGRAGRRVGREKHRAPHLGSRDWPSAGPQSPAAPETRPLPAAPCLGPVGRETRRGFTRRQSGRGPELHPPPPGGTATDRHGRRSARARDPSHLPGRPPPRPLCPRMRPGDAVWWVGQARGPASEGLLVGGLLSAVGQSGETPHRARDEGTTLSRNQHWEKCAPGRVEGWGARGSQEAGGPGTHHPETPTAPDTAGAADGGRHP